MGDRANIVLRSNWPDDLNEREAVFLYSHWGGSELPSVLGEVLDSPRARGRWNDETYLARIIFEAMIEGQEGTETGFGISTRLTDNEYPLLVLYAGCVYVLPESEYQAKGFSALEEAPSLAFRDYVSESRDWDDLRALQVRAEVPEDMSYEQEVHRITLLVAGDEPVLEDFARADDVVQVSIEAHVADRDPETGDYVFVDDSETP